MLARCIFLLALCMTHFVGVAIADTPDPNTYYRLSTAYRTSAMPLDVINGGPQNDFVHLVSKGDLTGQYWRLVANGDGTFKMTTQFRGPDNCLDVVNGGPNNNEPHLKACGDFTGQRWMIVPDGSWVRLKTKFRGDGMCLDIFNGGPKNNQPYFKPCGDFSGQRWRLEAVKRVAPTAAGGRPIVNKVCRWDGTAPACGGRCSGDWSLEGNARTDGDAKRMTWVQPSGGMPDFGEDCVPFTSKALCCRYE
jgi:Ricin-type beta-trefoil lectin domain